MPDTTYTSGSGNWTCPPGVTKAQILVWGGGGAGGGQNTTTDGGGGGGGGSFAENIDHLKPGTTYPYAVGAGGTGVASSAGNPGGISTWRVTLIIGDGGKGGSPSTGTPPIGGVAGLVTEATADLARYNTCTASHENPSYVAANANDGNGATRWAAPVGHTSDAWLKIDFTAPLRWNRVIIDWETQYASGYIIQSSTDDSTWTDEYTTLTGNGGNDDITLGTDVVSRYVRLYMNVRGTADSYSLWTLKFMSTGRGKYNGGYGARGRNNNIGIGGYGGSSGGLGAAGVSTSADTAWVQNFPGGNPSGSGAGGNGGAADANGSAGTAPGGGGGGSGDGTAKVGGAGAAGKVIVRYVPPCALLGIN